MAKTTKKTESKTVTVEQIGSPIRRPFVQRQTLIGLGVLNAINLDGGSSSTLAFGSQVINHPVFGVERPVAVNLGIFASPVPEPRSVALLALGGIGVVIGLRRTRSTR